MSRNRKKNGPGRYHRVGITLMQLQDMFPDEPAAIQWFEALIWPNGRACPRCGSVDTQRAAKTSGLPYYCQGCQKAFSVRIGTVLERSHVSFRQWAFAIYLEMTSLKGISGMKLHREIGVAYKTAWFMLHRIREAWRLEKEELFEGPVEVDESYFGGLRRNMSKSKREKLEGRGSVGKAAVVGVKDRKTNQVRAMVVDSTDAETLQGFVKDNTCPGTKVYTDDATAYCGLPFDHESVKHGVGEYVRYMAHTNGIESFWATLKRAHKGTYHRLSRKHLQRYISQFAGKHGVRSMDTIRQMEAVVIQLVGKRLMYRDLVG